MTQTSPFSLCLQHLRIYPHHLQIYRIPNPAAVKATRWEIGVVGYLSLYHCIRSRSSSRSSPFTSLIITLSQSSALCLISVFSATKGVRLMLVLPTLRSNLSGCNTSSYPRHMEESCSSWLAYQCPNFKVTLSIRSVNCLRRPILDRAIVWIPDRVRFILVRESR